MVDMKYVNSVWRPLKKQSVTNRKQKIYISSENKRHAQEGSCLETGFFWNTKGAIQSRGGKMCLQTLFTCLFCSQHCRWGLLVELLASQYPMNLHTMWNQLKRKWIFKQDDNDWKYIIHTLNKHNRCKKKKSCRLYLNSERRRQRLIQISSRVLPHDSWGDHGAVWKKTLMTRVSLPHTSI